VNVQLLMYGSKHLEQNFFLNSCEYHGVLRDLENPARSIDTYKTIVHVWPLLHCGLCDAP
jgi:hypothetical protein